MSERDVRLEDMLPLMLEALERGQSVRFSPRGTSMRPMLRQGLDSVTLSPVRGRLKKYDRPFYRRADGHYVLHRIVAVGETYTCVGDNQFQREPGLTHEQMLAVVTAFSRGEKEYSVNAPAYRLYCRFWHITRPVRHLWRWGIARIRRIFK